MKRKLVVIIALVGCLALASPAFAHFLWMEPIGHQTAAVGDEVTVNVYLHATYADGLAVWEMELGWDPSELEIVPYYDSAAGRTTYVKYGSTVLDKGFLDEKYVAGGSQKHPGSDWVDNLARQHLILKEELDEGEDFLLYSATFKFKGGSWGGEDIWLEAGDGFGFLALTQGGQTAGWIDGLLPVYTDNTGTTLLHDNGPDYASAVPIPGAVWLLGSGLFALAGIRLRKW